MERFRTFYAADIDQSLQSGNTDFSATEGAHVFDIGYTSTKTDISVDNLTLFQYRRERLRELQSSSNNQVTAIDYPTLTNWYTRRSQFPMLYAVATEAGLDQGTEQSGALQYSFEVAGYHGGGKSLWGPGTFDTQTMVGYNGSVLTHLDYGLADSVIPNDRCQPADRRDGLETRQVQRNNTTVTEYVDGEQRCFSYNVSFNVTRKLLLPRNQTSGNRPTTVTHGGDAVALNWSRDMVHREGPATMVAVAEIEATITETERIYDYDPEAPRTQPNGNWHLNNTITRVHSRSTASERIDLEVAFPQRDRLNLTQTVINISDNRKHVIIRAERDIEPRWNTLQFAPLKEPETLPRRLDLNRNRLLQPEKIPQIVPIVGYNLTPTRNVLTGWGVFSGRTGGYSQQYRLRRMGSSEFDGVRTNQAILTQYIMMQGFQPRLAIEPGTVNGSTRAYPMRIPYARFTAFDTPRRPRLPPTVNLSSTRPRIYERIVVKNVPSNVSNAISIHGNEIEFDQEPRVIPPDIPQFEFQQQNGSVRITVTNRSGKPIEGKTLKIRGATPRRVETGPSGTVIVNQHSPTIGVTVPHDPWDNPGDRFVVEATTSRVLPMGGQLIDRVRGAVSDGLIASIPLLLYLVVRRIWTGPTTDSIRDKL